MSKTQVITSRIDTDMVAQLDQLGAHYDRSRAWLVAEAVKQYVEREAAFMAFLQQGVNDLDQGRWTSHEDLVQDIRERRATQRAA